MNTIYAENREEYLFIERKIKDVIPDFNCNILQAQCVLCVVLFVSVLWKITETLLDARVSFYIILKIKFSKRQTAGRCKMLLPIAGTKHHQNLHMKVSLKCTISMLAKMYVFQEGTLLFAERNTATTFETWPFSGLLKR